MLFQDAQAEFQDQNVRRNLRERGQDSSLDSAYRHSADKVSEVFVEGKMALLDAGCVFEVESICIS